MAMKSKKSRAMNVYICRECRRADFKKQIDFTRHLERCLGPESNGEKNGCVSMKDHPPGDFRRLALLMKKKAGELNGIADLILRKLA